MTKSDRRLPGESNWQLAGAGGPTLRGFVRRGSEGRSGVFIHGLRSHCDGEKARGLSELAGSRGWSWLRFDQRGCGASEGDFRRFTISDAVEDLGRILDGLGAPCILVGSSLGGLIALQAALLPRHRVEGLLLIAPALRFADRFILDQLDEHELACWARRGYRWFPDLYAGGCFRLDYRFCADALRYREPPVTLPCPLRVIHGTRDELLPPDDTREWVSRVDCPARDLEIVDGGDHRLSGWMDRIIRHAETLWHETRKRCA